MSSTALLGPVMFDPRLPALDAETREFLRHPAAGGVILFSRHYESQAQIAGFIAELRALRPELLVGVDHEGGRVQRFRPGFTRLPAAARYAERLRGAALLQALERGGWLMAAELRAVGVDFSFAPVLDVDRGLSQIIGDRAFSRDAEAVGACALAFAQGMRRAGMAAVGKHFPGHGAVALDSHLALPVDPRPYADILAQDLPPFQKLIAQGLEAIMPAHIVYPEVDPRQPAGFSTRWIRDILRGELGFAGAVFSDDLSMEGAARCGGLDERAHLALEAGCDMVLVCNQAEAVGGVLEALENQDWKSHQARLSAMRGRFPISRAALAASAEWRAAVECVQSLQESAA
jgi:beta-N-acetylhexosaminidase